MYGCSCGCGGFTGGYGGYGFHQGCYYPRHSSFILIVVLFILLIIVGRSYAF